MKTKTLSVLLVFAMGGVTGALANHDRRPSAGHSATVVYHSAPRTVATTTYTTTVTRGRHYHRPPVVYRQVHLHPAPVYHAPPVYHRAPVYVHPCPPPPTRILPRFSFGFYF